MGGDVGLGNSGGDVVLHAGRHGRKVPLVNDDAVRQAAASDQAEHPVARLPAEHARPCRGHLPGDLEPRDVRGRAGRRGVETHPLRHVGPVDAREAAGHQDLVGTGDRVRALLQPDHLVAARPGEDDSSHG